MNKDVNFKEALIKNNLIFQNAKILNNIDDVPNALSFLNAKIEGNAYFDNFWALDDPFQVDGRSNFVGFELKNYGYFNGANFIKEVDFRAANFIKDVYFQETHFNEFVNFKDSMISRKGIFDRILNFNASFEGTILKNVAFRHCDLTNVQFNDAILDNCDLTTSGWKNKIPEHRKFIENKTISYGKLQLHDKFLFICNHLGILLDNKLIPSAKVATNTYRRIRQSLQQQGAYDIAGNLYYEEMNIKKEVFFIENQSSWLVYVILSITTGYGEKLRRILAIFLFGWVFYIIIVIYFSAVYNFVIPLGAGFLSLLTALFVYVFARKMSR